MKKFVIEAARPFLVPPGYGDKGGTDIRVNSVDEPLRTICGNRGSHAIVEPTLVPSGTFIMPNNTNNVPKGTDEPVPTITTGNRNFLVAPVFMKAKTYGGGGNDARSAELPLNTITASKRGEHALAAAYLVHRSNGERPGQEPRIYDAEKPLGTICAGGNKHALCAAMLVKHNGGNNDAHGSSGQGVDQPVDALCTKNTKALTVAHLVRYNGENSEGSARGQAADQPISTLDTSRRMGVVASHLVKMRGTSEAHVDASAHDVTEPMPTISARGTHLAEIETELAPIELSPELADRARRVAAFLVRYNGTGDAESVESPLGTLTTKDRYGLVTVEINGEEYVVVDIKMRMLEPRELFRAQGFDDSYEIAPQWNGKPLSKTAQIRMCGNSVCPPIATAIVRAALGLDDVQPVAEAA